MARRETAGKRLESKGIVILDRGNRDNPYPKGGCCGAAFLYLWFY